MSLVAQIADKYKKRLTFNLKLILLTYLPVVLMVMLLLFAFMLPKILEKFDNAIDISQEVQKSYLVLNLGKDNLIESKISEDQYFEGAKEKKIEKLLIEISYCDSLIGMLSEFDDVYSVGLSNSFYNLLEYNKLYKRSLESVTEKLYELGTGKYGVVGKLEQSIDMAQNLTKDLTTITYIYQLKENVKNYQIYHKRLYYNKFMAAFNAFDNYLNSTNGKKAFSGEMPYLQTGVVQADSTLRDSTQKMKTVYSDMTGNAYYGIKSIDNYRFYFNMFITYSEIIGITSQEGLKGDLNRLRYKIESELSMIYIKLQNEKKAARQFYFVMFSIIVLLVMILVYFLTQRYYKMIKNTLEHISDSLYSLSLGIKSKIEVDSNTEDVIQKFHNTHTNFTKVFDTAVMFTNQLTNGNLGIEYSKISDSDSLGDSLISLKNSLLQRQKEENNRIDSDKLRAWQAHGLTKFNDILRMNFDNIQELSYEIIRNICDYIEANQGGIFILNDNDIHDIHLELAASYAYNRRKYLDKKILPGEGIVGNCYIEKKSSYITQVPEGYTTITSGMGEATPTHLIVLPIKYEEVILGIIEIASFERFENHKILFLEELADDIGSTIASVRTNEKTNYLLEQSRQQSEMMNEQEEQMRRNLEMINEIQEDLTNKTNYIEQIKKIIDKEFISAEIGTDGKFIYANNLFLEFVDIKLAELRERSIWNLFSKEQSKVFEPIWKEITTYKTVSYDWERTLRNNTIISYRCTFAIDSSSLTGNIIIIGSLLSITEKTEPTL